jgi:hypothetical protein
MIRDDRNTDEESPRSGETHAFEKFVGPTVFF